MENTELGYHGYWAKNIYKVNPNFGTEQDLIAFVQAAHSRDIAVMIDVVFNHIGYVPNGKDFSEIVPFNDEKFYHEWCEISDNDFKTNNQENIERCRLFGLPDLHTEKEEVKAILYKWIVDDVLRKF